MLAREAQPRPRSVRRETSPFGSRLPRSLSGPPTAPAFYPVPVRQLRILLPASFLPRLAATQLPSAVPANRPVEDLHLQHQPILVHRKSQGAQNAPWLANTKTAVDLICCSRPAVRGWDAESTSSRAKTEARRHTGCSPTGRQSRESKRTCPEPDRRHRWRRAACRRA